MLQKRTLIMNSKYPLKTLQAPIRRKLNLLTIGIILAVVVSSGSVQQNVTKSASGTVLLSHDGMHWDQHDQEGPWSLNAVAYANGHFVVGGDSGVVLQSGEIISLTPT